MRRLAYGLLFVPAAATLIPALYDRADPTLFGLPFFYWYQLAWVVITAALLWFVARLTRERGDV